ncbi:MAG: 50S ribosomal protein L20 [Chloroflexi bacterium]|nr:50S ribosomal protein L20 [Chloroflexota bacterium]
MSRVKRGVTQQARHKKILKLAKGFHSARHKLFKTANEAVLHSLDYAYRDRRNKKRDFHRLWIVRINAAARQNGMTYSQLMSGLRTAGVEINRKMLAEMAVNDGAAFTSLVALARGQASEAATA